MFLLKKLLIKIKQVTLTNSQIVLRRLIIAAIIFCKLGVYALVVGAILDIPSHLWQATISGVAILFALMYLKWDNIQIPIFSDIKNLFYEFKIVKLFRKFVKWLIYLCLSFIFNKFIKYFFKVTP